MKVLMATWGWRTHFYPLVPLGWALQAAGHEVRVAAQPSLADVVVAAGLPAVPVGEDLDFTKVFAGQVGRVSTSDATASGRTAPDATASGRTAPDGMLPAVTADGGVVRFADAMLDDLIGFGHAFGPDLIVYEPFNLAGSLAAAALGVPDVRLLWGPDSSTELELDEDQVIGPRADRLGVGEVNLAGALTLDPCPAPMQVPLAAPSQPIRFVPYNGAALVPQWLHEPPARPRVCVTWGTMMAALGLTDLVGVPLVVQGLAGLDVEVVLAVDAGQRSRLLAAGLPPNVRLARSPLALHLVLPTCRALVQQGGAGTTMTGLACGVPQLVLPQVSDQHFNATQLAATGAGTWLPAEEADPAALRARVTELLDDDRWWRAAQEMRERMVARPTPADVVPVLQRLAGIEEVDCA